MAFHHPSTDNFDDSPTHTVSQNLILWKDAFYS